METKKDWYRRGVKIMGLSLLFVLQTVTPIVMRTVGGTPWGWIGAGVISGPIWFLFWATFCYCWWRMLELPGRWMPRDKVVWSALVLLPVVLIGGCAVYRSWPTVRAARILSNGELAPLPPSANRIKVHTWFSPMSGEEYLRFSATRDDIERFLATSPILCGVEYVEYSEDGMTLFYPRDDRRPLSPEDLRTYMLKTLRGPPWFVKELKGPMKRYRICPEGCHSAGAVIVDEERNLVYVRLIFS